MSQSEEITAKIQIPESDLRRILASQFKSEIVSSIWADLKKTFTLGGVVSASLVLGLVGSAYTLGKGEIEDQVKFKLQEATQGVERRVREEAERIAQAAVQKDITRVDDVRRRVAYQMPEMLREALTSSEIQDIIRTRTAEQAAEQLRNPSWRRAIERSVLAQRAADETLSATIRYLAFTDLIQDAEGLSTAVQVLVASSGRLIGAQEPPNIEGGNFLAQALPIYVNRLPLMTKAEDFSNQEPLLRNLLALATGLPSAATGFEQIIHKIDHPLLVTFLSRAARESSGAKRAIVLQTLIGHSSIEARERTEGLFCGTDVRLRDDLLRAANQRPDSIPGDAEGELFLQISRCLESSILSNRIPRYDLSCIPGGEVYSLWQRFRFPASGQNLSPLQSRQSGSVGKEQIFPSAARCGGLESILRSQMGHLRAPGGWSRLVEGSTAGWLQSPVLGLKSLLPDNEAGETPAWLFRLMDARSQLGLMIRAPERNPALAALILERLSFLPDHNPMKSDAWLQIGLVLAGSPADEFRFAERLLLDMLSAGNVDFCSRIFMYFTEFPPHYNNSALAESAFCLSDRQSFSVEHRHAFLSMIAKIGNDRRRDKTISEKILAGIALSLGVGERGASAPINLMNWITTMPRRFSQSQGEIKLMADAIEALLFLEGPAALSQMFENSLDNSFSRFARQARERPELFGPFVKLAPYLDQNFLDLIRASQEIHQAGGRFWTFLRVTNRTRFLTERDDGLVILRLDPLRVMPVAIADGRSEPEELHEGEYIIGALHRETLVNFRPVEVFPTPGFLSMIGTDSLELNFLYRSEIGASGPRFYPFLLEAGQLYVFRTSRLAEPLDTIISLYDAQGEMVDDAINDDYGNDWSSRLCVSVTEAGRYWLKIAHYDSLLVANAGFEFSAMQDSKCLDRR